MCKEPNVIFKAEQGIAFGFGDTVREAIVDCKRHPKAMTAIRGNFIRVCIIDTVTDRLIAVVGNFNYAFQLLK
ncbi:MAG: hypothetical protein KAJ19_10720 [Gammaproteobacteria bacterium]|nr:hypothetical protein [Gammaproteobacteria bacterium]